MAPQPWSDASVKADNPACGTPVVPLESELTDLTTTEDPHAVIVPLKYSTLFLDVPIPIETELDGAGSKAGPPYQHGEQ